MWSSPDESTNEAAHAMRPDMEDEMNQRTLITTEPRPLEVKLTEEERRTKADQAAETSARGGDARREEEGHKDMAKLARARAETHEQEAGDLLRVYRRGAEDRTVSVQVLYDDGDKLVHEVRMDTGAEIKTRTPTADELVQIQQLTLDDVGKARRRGKAEA